MGMANDVKNLSEDIVTAHDARIKAMGTLVKETQLLARDTHTMLKGFNREHKETSVQQARTLAEFVTGMKNNVAGILKGFSAKHKEMSAQQAKELAAFMADLTKNVGSMVKGFSAEHKAMAASLKASLKGNTRDIETYVKSKLREFSAAHAEMSSTLKQDLEKYVANIINATCELLAGFHGERESMGAHWQDMTAVMARKRGAKPVDVEAGVKAETAEATVEKPKKRKPANKN